MNIYVDAVINHICGAGGGECKHSSCGTYFNANTKDFPSVPYSAWDFNDGKCYTGSGNIENYNDINKVNPQFSFGEVVKSISELKGQIEDIWQREIKTISTEGKAH